MSTALSSSDAYATGADLAVFHDRRQLGDLIGDLGQRVGGLNGPSDSQLNSSALVIQHLKAASGLVEGACLKGERYNPTDLGTTLDGVSKQMLVRLVAELAFWTLWKRRYSGADMFPDTVWAYQTIDALGEGAKIFGLEEAAAAGKPAHDFMTAGEWDDLGLASDQACRLFGERAKHTRPIG